MKIAALRKDLLRCGGGLVNARDRRYNRPMNGRTKIDHWAEAMFDLWERRLVAAADDPGGHTSLAELWAAAPAAPPAGVAAQAAAVEAFKLWLVALTGHSLTSMQAGLWDAFATGGANP